MASQLENELCIKHCWGVYEQTSIVKHVRIDDWTAKWMIIASKDRVDDWTAERTIIASNVNSVQCRWLDSRKSDQNP